MHRKNKVTLKYICNAKTGAMLTKGITHTILILLLLFSVSCQAQNKTHVNMKNPLLCDPSKGICEISEDSVTEKATIKTHSKRIKVVYFTDPICSSCWGIEPQLRKLKLEYGHTIEIEYRMGGLLPDWNYNSGGISKPSDVAHHWDEVSIYYDMPIDGDVWLENALHSSYPPSIAFKAAQIQSNDKAILFLREIREMVFLKKINITKWVYLEAAAQKAGLDTQQFKMDFEKNATAMFEEDLKLAKQMGVRGFPTLFFINDEEKNEVVYGSKPYSNFEEAVLKLHKNAVKRSYDTSSHFVFSKYNTLTAKEFSVLTETPREECEKILDDMVLEGTLEKWNTKNGGLWISTKY